MSTLKGTPEDWGLTREKFSELDAELTDHLYCLQGEAGDDATCQARDRLNQAGERRRLTAPHLADQVVGTLNRLPTKREWLDLLWLLCWFALIVVSDLVSARADYIARDGGSSYLNGEAISSLSHYTIAVGSAWFLQAAARAGFFVSFGVTLWRAYKLGWGVLLARVLQLKLVHTVLVVTATLVIGTSRYPAYFFIQGIESPWPVGFTAPVFLAVCVALAVLLYLVKPRRLLAFSLGLVLMGVFLYAGGPVIYRKYKIKTPISVSSVLYGSDEAVKQALNKYDRISEKAGKWGLRRGTGLDRQNNLQLDWNVYTAPVPLNIFSSSNIPDTDLYKFHQWTNSIRKLPEPYGISVDCEWVVLPISFQGAGLAWLAAPIPFLGVLGLLGMLFILGRRSLKDMLVYSVLCLAAIATTLMPFLHVYDAWTNTENFGASALVHSPFPAFEYTLISARYDYTQTLYVTMVIGLILSAGIPWLLTSLFLGNRSKASPVTRREA